METNCVPAKTTGRAARHESRKVLEERDGPPPFEKAVCRHLCKNDSTEPNGFNCTLHTVWGTVKENMADANVWSAGGKVGGPKSKGRKNPPLSEEAKRRKSEWANSEEGRAACATGGGANTEEQKEARLEVTTRIYTCHCGRTGKGPAFVGKHIKKCLTKFGESISKPD